MDDDAGGFLARPGLKSDPKPAASFAGFPVAAGGHGVGEGKESLRIATGRTEAFEQLGELQFQHRLQAFPAHITLCRTIKRITDRHVIGRDRLRHRSCRAADQEEPSRDFLAAANLSERSIGRGVEIYRQRLLPRSRFAFIHNRAPPARTGYSPPMWAPFSATDRRMSRIKNTNTTPTAADKEKT